MKEFFKDIKSDKTIILVSLTNVFSIIAAVIFILFFYNHLPPFIPVFNQLPWGEKRLGVTFTIFIPVLAALLILVINMFIASKIYTKIPLVSRMLVAISLLIAIITFLFVVKTITLVL